MTPHRDIVAWFVLAGLLTAATAGSEGSSNPWLALAELRAHLEAQSPLRARFVQTYVPAGFSSGEREEGWFAIALPECLRWDYADPYPKSFLLCARTIYYWNPEERSGQRYDVENEEEPGLDFFLLTIEDLRVRYNAAAEEAADGSLSIQLLPLQPSSDVVEANLHLDRDRRRIEALTYRDVEGNLTRFEIRDYQPGAGAELFTPPADVEWEEP